ncbi:tRNA-binding protein [Atopobacter phocae]|uniref:tRNA-binding protein n=1 Tax=Atopobacter phocae TaxID=136492 RepID=UPI00046FCED5|nr:tRNA-binding protein [Atopobacter phocae]
MTTIKADITLEDLNKIDIRVGLIEEVKDIIESKHMIAMTVDFGSFKRTILAGMKQEREHPKEELEGKQALFVVNLPPKKMFGYESHGMVYDIGYEDGITPVLAQPESSVPNGTRVG